MERREFVASLVAGGCAGMCVDLTLFPLDTIKTRLQSQQGFYKAGGFRGIYAGVPSAAVGSFPNAAAFFVTYDCTKSLLGAGGVLAAPHLAPVTHMLAASLGEIVACLIRVPTEVVKQRAQASPSSSTYWILLATVREEGVRGLYRGFRSTVLREIPFSLVQFPLWEYLKTLWSWRQGHTLYSWQAAVCGAFAGAVAAFVTTPLDVAKTRIMLAKAGSTTASGNIPLVLYDVWRSRGLTGLFAGSIPRVTFISVGGFIFLGAYEKVRHTLL
ncbi:S-adenosylmethionine mitochondrial carrier protein isoform X1 [Acanthopagrus latus]|uniref:S-adenosylmethionine mitochondrial carrier protein isoform X1 n=2 Tax=Acanthopagrus latus TaxID=8177 RepID=UPI00187C3C26|nr:S-adenosylmethionine mitochondrial carrier protein isoform X1 [Acanthopagrus latus]